MDKTWFFICIIVLLFSLLFLSTLLETHDDEYNEWSWTRDYDESKDVESFVVDEITHNTTIATQLCKESSNSFFNYLKLLDKVGNIQNPCIVRTIDFWIQNKD